MAGMHGKHELEPHESAALLQRRSSCAGRHAEPDRSDDFLVALAGALEEHSDTVTGTIIFNLNISKGTKVLAEHLPASSPCVQRSFSPARVVEGIFINGKKKRFSPCLTGFPVKLVSYRAQRMPSNAV